MASDTTHPQTHPQDRTAYASPDTCCPPCPDCGGLDCLCRPRFYAGQLLTEKDLNALQDYVVAKNKLHNRYVVGAGIVCGLEALCDPCGAGVRVSEGYAISPCGEDIVVCETDNVDICRLIQACREIEGPDCRPYAPGEDGCADMIESWVLTIRYAEAPSREAPAASGDCGCGASCGCGCSGGCGGSCGCSSAPAQARTPVRRSAEPVLRRGAPPACVPQFTCESYRYDVFRLPEEPRRDDPDRNRYPLSSLFENVDGAMSQRLRCCLREIEESIPPVPTLDSTSAPTEADRRRLAQWLCDIKDALRRLIRARGVRDCGLMARLAAVAIPSPANPQSFEAIGAAALQEMIIIAFELAVDCLCSALLPACPAPGDPRIPIAVVKVRRSPCEVVSVCNWTPLRRQLVTWQSVGYWLGWLPQIAALREYLHALCCRQLGLFDNRRDIDDDDGNNTVPGPEGFAAAAGDGQAARFGPFASRDPGFDVLFARSLGSVMRRRAAGDEVTAGGTPGLDADDLATLFTGPRGPNAGSARPDAASRVLDEISRPLREAFTATGLAGVTGTAPKDGPGASGPTEGPETGVSARELDDLRAQLEAQAARINELEKAATAPRNRNR